MGVSNLHKEGLHGKGSSSSWLYGRVVHVIRHFSSLSRGFLERGFFSNSNYTSMLYWY